MKKLTPKKQQLITTTTDDRCAEIRSEPSTLQVCSP
jgi:hypothetical protein